MVKAKKLHGNQSKCPVQKSLVCAISSALMILSGMASAADPFAVTNQTKWYTSTITLNFSEINKDLWWKNSENSALFLLDGTKELGRTCVDWWTPGENGTDKHLLYETVAGDDWDKGWSAFPSDEYIKLTVTDGGEGFNLGWDFGNDTKTHAYTPAIANFRDDMLNPNSNEGKDNKNGHKDRWLKHFVFDSTNDRINVVTTNAVVGGTNAGNSSTMLGLSISNKRGWMTFADETFLVTDFKFKEVSENENKEGSGTENEYIAAGVYTAFGANKNGEGTVGDDTGLYEQMFKKNESGNLTADPKDGLDKYGLIEFEKRATIVVNALSSVDPEHDKFGEVFGLLANEGGSIVLEQGGDIIAKGRDSHHLVSAIGTASTYGVLDPLKQGAIAVTAGDGLNRIWGWSDSYGQKDGEDQPYRVVDDNELFTGENGSLNQDVFENLGTSVEDYLEKATVGTTDQVLRTSILAANGSVVTVNDNGTGYFDIRGDVIAALKNGDGAKSNTFSKEPNLTDMSGTVTRAEVSITLKNSQSTLVGNIYERHRVGDEANFGIKEDFNSQSFTEWADAQLELEQGSLGGIAKVTLANGATWFPVRQWGGWNFDVLYDDFITDDHQINPEYERYDNSDQYNLNVWSGEDGKYFQANTGEVMPLVGDASTKINDLDLLDPGISNSVPSAAEKGTNFTSVDNGIYHLKLDGGVLDLYYLRNDFQMSTDQKDLGKVALNQDLAGVKKFRIQALSGTGGSVRMYAKDAENHDLLIVDERRDLNNQKITDDSTTSLNLVFWNETNTTDLGISANDPSTYVHVARLPDNVNLTAVAYGPGRTTYTSYHVATDQKNADGEYDENSWTYQQKQDWHKLNNNWFITSNGENKTDMAVVGTTQSAASLGYLMATSMETLRDRRGEARYNGTQEDGLWVRYTHNNFGMDGFEAKTDGFQMGYEYKVDTDSDGLLLRGLAFDYAQADVEYSEMSGQSEADRYRLSAYQTYMANNGFYYDLIGRVGWYNADTNLQYRRELNSTLYQVQGDFDYWAAAASFELGKRWESDSAWWIEPQAQLQYTFIDGYDYTSSQGIAIDADDTNSLIGRAGLRAGKVLKGEADKKMEVWLGFDVLHEWLGDRSGTMTGVDQSINYEVSGDDTWYDGVLGLTWETGSDSRLWAIFKRDFGGDKDNTWTINAGATWNF